MLVCRIANQRIGRTACGVELSPVELRAAPFTICTVCALSIPTRRKIYIIRILADVDLDSFGAKPQAYDWILYTESTSSSFRTLPAGVTQALSIYGKSFGQSRRVKPPLVCSDRTKGGGLGQREGMTNHCKSVVAGLQERQPEQR